MILTAHSDPLDGSIHLQWLIDDVPQPLPPSLPQPLLCLPPSDARVRPDLSFFVAITARERTP